MANKMIQSEKVFDGVEVSAGSSETSDAVKLQSKEGYFSIQEEITGDGTVKLEYLVSIDGENFLEPSEASDIATGQTKTSGPGSDGKDIISFEPVLSPWIKIKATETVSSNSVTATVYLGVQ